METVKAIGPHPIDLDDGRTLGPGEIAEDVPMNAHNKALVEDGHIAVVQQAEPKRDTRPNPDKEGSEK